MKKGLPGTNRRQAILMSTLFLLPAFAFLTFGFLIPFGWNVVLSFQEWSGFEPARFVGFQNFTGAFRDPVFRISVRNSVIIGLGITVFAVAIGVVLALLIYRMRRREGAVYRLVIFMPSMIPITIIGLLFTFIFNPDMGMLNQLLRLLGFSNLTMAWLENKTTVLVCLIAVGVWRIMGITMMLVYAALQAVPPSLLGAGLMDGASYRQQVFYILLPLVRSTVRLAALFTLLQSFRTYDLVYLMTRGGPANASKTVPIYMDQVAFQYSEFGYSSAMGLVMALVVVLCILLVNVTLRGESYEL